LFADNVFINNTATLYGPTFAGHSSKLVLTRVQTNLFVVGGDIRLLSGGIFPFFSVFVQDMFNQTVVPSELRRDFLIAYASVTNRDGVNTITNATTLVGFEESMLQGARAATFNRLQVVGLAGDYSLLILPRLNFDPLVINARVNFSLSECMLPRVMHTFGKEPFPQCVNRTLCFSFCPVDLTTCSFSFLQWRL
jgi:hypothetical protein